MGLSFLGVGTPCLWLGRERGKPQIVRSPEKYTPVHAPHFSACPNSCFPASVLGQVSIKECMANAAGGGTNPAVVTLNFVSFV